MRGTKKKTLGAVAPHSGKLWQTVKFAMDRRDITTYTVKHMKDLKHVTHVTLMGIKNGVITWNLDILEELSKILGVSFEALRQAAFEDHVAAARVRGLKHYRLPAPPSLPAVDSKGERHLLPVFSVDALNGSLSKKGVPTKKPLYYLECIAAPEVGAYGVLVPDRRFEPAIPLGYVAVTAPSVPVPPVHERIPDNSFAVVGTRSGNIYAGKLSRPSDPKWYVIQSDAPEHLKQVRRYDVTFIHFLIDRLFPFPTKIVAVR